MAINTSQANNALNGLLQGSPAAAPAPVRPSNKIPPRPGSGSTGDIPMTSWYLENTQANHYKYYTVMVSDRGHCFFAWGRIGSAGQSKSQKFMSAQEAEDAGLRQSYAKQAKGYVAKQSGVKFTVPEVALDKALEHNDVRILDAERRKASQDPAFVGQQKAATKHYDDFIKTAEVFMAKASNTPVALLFDDWQALQESWAELDDRHQTAATTVALAGQMIQAALLA